MRGIVGNPSCCRCPSALRRRSPSLLRYAFAVTSSLRRFSLVLLWLLFALLPLRGWANLTMHLPVQGAPVAAPCHGGEGQSAAEPADASTTCTLCDVCHGAVLLRAGSTPQHSDRRAQPLPVAVAVAAPAVVPDGLYRPPRR